MGDRQANKHEDTCLSTCLVLLLRETGRENESRVASREDKRLLRRAGRERRGKGLRTWEVAL